MRLNLGCGDDIRDGWHNVDIADGPGVDQVYDLQETPWPWDNSSADTILMDNVLEHIGPMYRTEVIEECRRVLKFSGRLVVRTPVPEVGCGWDLTHYTVPSWRWPLHPRWRGSWTVLSMTGSRVGPGRVMPEGVARLATRFGIARCVDQVEVVMKP